MMSNSESVALLAASSGEVAQHSNRSRKRSVVWQYFEEFPNEGKGKCKHCGSKLPYHKGIGISHLQNHVRTSCKELPPDIDRSSIFPKSVPCEEFDVLRWWKRNQDQYPVLAKMARDFLAIPLSTVASESTFSTAGMVIDKYRNSLSSETVEALICTKDWLKAYLSDDDDDDGIVTDQVRN
nr:zinc finger BED domain-containing protein DAYSLEEPER-like [Setaria viridis]